MNNAQLAQAIKNKCKEKGISVSKMLSDCKIRKSLIYDLEKRDWTPSLEIAEQITNYLECSIDFLLGRSEAEFEAPEDEHRLIKAYRQLTDEGKRSVLHQAENFAKDPFYQKYTDIPKEA